ncbi:MAG: hypothetical protein H7061_12005 [Bdellovibrionaceae bacterium]|nr:hypothetical protein [Bdellovibrio sp.]
MRRLVSIISALYIMQSCASVPPPEAPPEEPVAVAEPAKVEAVPAPAEDEPLTKYSELNNMAPPSDRNYRRMTRQKMEEESELYGSAGSLWKMEGQTSFLFAENKHRREGDPTSIKMEGSALKLVENKVVVIQELLLELAAQKKKAEEDAIKAEEEKVRLAKDEAKKKLEEEAATLEAERIARGEIQPPPPAEAYAPEPEPVRAPASEIKPVVVAPPPAPKLEKIDLKEIDLIPSKIVEQLPDGIFRIRGQQYLTIGKRPYKVIATALIRAEDFNDSNISSTKLLDAQYDVIHVKRTAE